MPVIYADNPALRSLQAKQLELERAQATDSLRKHLEKRPERDELVERMLHLPPESPRTDYYQATSSPTAAQHRASKPTRRAWRNT